MCCAIWKAFASWRFSLNRAVVQPFPVHRYERLAAWQRCHELTLAVYRTSSEWPPIERFGLVTQARRAAGSACANIAEGSAKRGSAEFRRFLDISLGSLAELSYWLRLAKDLGFAHQSHGTVERLLDEASATTWGLYRSMPRR